MTPTAAERMDDWGRRLAPFATVLVLLFFGLVPFGVPGLPLIAPAGTQIAVFYWAVYRPDLMPPLAAFGLGFIQDALAGTPLGIASLAFLILHGIAVNQRKTFIGKPFLLVWLGLAVGALLAAFASWALASALLGGVIPLERPLFQALATIALFPCFCWVLVRIHRGVVH
ncbi:MAG: rod shape-determining protein MreD [Alphaproteobacteria bacterium]|nr:rod shape-determining protein MreD [Alphaproteobacteria bacterium]